MAEPDRAERRGVAPSLPDLVAAHRSRLVRLVEQAAGDLLRYETTEDLAQGACARALEFGKGFLYRGEKEFLGWFFQVAHQHLVQRRDYWSALKRGVDVVRRLTTFGPSTVRRRRGGSPASPTPGPSTVASSKEQIALAFKAVALLLPRDQDLVRWMTEGLSIEETAARLGVTYDAAERARLRAVERLRRAYAVAATRRASGGGRSSR